MRNELGFLIPVFVNSNFTKAQIFCNSKTLSDLLGNCGKIALSSSVNISAAWLSNELKKFKPELLVLKLNGDNSYQEKERICQLFKSRYIKVK